MKLVPVQNSDTNLNIDDHYKDESLHVARVFNMCNSCTFFILNVNKALNNLGQIITISQSGNMPREEGVSNHGLTFLSSYISESFIFCFIRV